MNQEKQQEIFLKELDRLTTRMLDELDITTVSIIGILELHKLNLFEEMKDVAEEDSDSDT